MYENDLIYHFSTSNNSRIYKYIRSITGNSSIALTVYLDSVHATADPDKASLFNTHFHFIFTHSSFDLPSLGSLSTPASTICDFTISSSEVSETLSSLDSTKAMGIDGIGTRLLKECAHVLYLPFHYLFCPSFELHSIPQEWRTNMITPIHKAVDRTLVSNYRPISLLCSKVLERIVYKHLFEFVYGSISTKQYGFLKIGPLYQLLTFLNDVHSSLQCKF